MLVLAQYVAALCARVLLVDVKIIGRAVNFMNYILRKPAQSVYACLVLLSTVIFLSIIASQPLPGTSLHPQSAIKVDAIITKLWTEPHPGDRASEIASETYGASISFVIDGEVISRHAQVSKRFYDTSLIGQIITIKYFREADGHVIIDARFQDDHFGLWMLLILKFTCLAFLGVKIALKAGSNARIEISRALIRPHLHHLCVNLFLYVGIMSILFVAPALSRSVEASIWMLFGWPSAFAAVCAWILPIILTVLAKFVFDDLFVASDKAMLFSSAAKNNVIGSKLASPSINLSPIQEKFLTPNFTQ